MFCFLQGNFEASGYLAECAALGLLVRPLAVSRILRRTWRRGGSLSSRVQGLSVCLLGRMSWSGSHGRGASSPYCGLEVRARKGRWVALMSPSPQ